MMRIWVVIAAAIVSGGLLLSATGSESVPVPEAHRPIDTRATMHWNRHMADSAITILRSGDVLLRMGMGAQSQMLARMNRGNKDFSHCGIVVMEKGYPFVYHCIGGEDNPDARMRRDSASVFLSPQTQLAFCVVRYPLDSAAIKQQVLSWFHKRPRFDMQFDLATNDKLYCTELVYKVLTGVAGDRECIPTDTVMGHRFVGTGNLCANPMAQLVWQVKYK